MAGELFLPLLVIDAEKFDDGFVRHIEFSKIEIVGTRQPSDRRSDRGFASLAAIDDPLEHAHVVAETRPKKFAVLAFAEPVHVEDERRTGQAFSNF